MAEHRQLLEGYGSGGMGKASTCHRFGRKYSRTIE